MMKLLPRKREALYLTRENDKIYVSRDAAWIGPLSVLVPFYALLAWMWIGDFGFQNLSWLVGLFFTVPLFNFAHKGQGWLVSIYPEKLTLFPRTFPEHHVAHPAFQKLLSDYLVDGNREYNRKEWEKRADDLTLNLYELDKAQRRMMLKNAPLDNYNEQVENEIKMIEGEHDD